MKIVISIFFVLISCLVVTAQVKTQCPTIEVVGPSKLTLPGGIMIFEARTAEPLSAEIKYVWTISAGVIESGHGTKSITVRVPSDGSVAVVDASVRIIGTDSCLVIGKKTADVAPYLDREPLDAYGILKLNDEKVRLQTDAESVKSNPGSKLLILRNLAETRKADMLRIRQLSNFLIECGLRRDQFQFIVQSHPDSHTIIFVTPKDFVYKSKY